MSCRTYPATSCTSRSPQPCSDTPSGRVSRDRAACGLSLPLHHTLLLAIGEEIVGLPVHAGGLSGRSVPIGFGIDALCIFPIACRQRCARSNLWQGDAAKTDVESATTTVASQTAHPGRRSLLPSWLIGRYRQWLPAGGERLPMRSYGAYEIPRVVRATRLYRACCGAWVRRWRVAHRMAWRRVRPTSERPVVA